MLAIERETMINLCDATDTAIIETYQRVWINKILKAKRKAEENGRGDEIVIVRQTENMIEAIVPKKCIRLAAPTKQNELSDEEKAKRKERMEKMRAARFGNAVPKSSAENNNDDCDEFDEYDEFDDYAFPDNDDDENDE